MLTLSNTPAWVRNTIIPVILGIVFLTLQTQAQSSWPADNMFVGYTYATSLAVQDPNDIPNNQIEFDLIYDVNVSPYTVQIAVANSTVYFRLQVRNITSWTVGTYLIFIADQSGNVLGKTYLTLTGNSGSIHLLNATGTVDLTTGSGSHNTNIGGWARFTSISGTTYEYVDFQLPQTTFESTLGINSSSQIRFYAGTSTGGGNINNINTDWMTPSTNGTPTATDFSALSLASLYSINLGALPVELSSFTAHMKDDRAVLRWRTATEINNFGFEIERSAGGEKWDVIGFIPGAGTSNSPRSYDFEDSRIPQGSVLRYRLRQIDRDGSFEYSPIVEVRQDLLVAQGITGYFPSPARATTTITFALQTSGTALLTLHDLAGRQLMTLAENAADAGVHSAILDVGDLPRGMYLLRLQSADGLHVRPLLVTD